MEIIYEPHPVSPERKAELRAQGYKIIDARFRPATEPEAITRESIAKMKRADVLDLLDAHGVDLGEVADFKVGELRSLLTEIMFADL
jgi:hypothetical protein